MGGEFSGIRTEEDFLKEFEEIRRESDIHFGSVIIFKNKKNPKFNVLVKEKIILATDELTSFLEQARLRSTIRCKNVAPLVEMFVHTDKKLCSTTYRAMTGFEFHERSLEKLLRQRKTYENEEAQMMSEVDAWGVLSDLVTALRAYRERGLYHGDLQPACIFVMNDKTLKLVDSCFMSDAISAFDRRYHDCSYKSPLSPQALAALTLGPKYANFDREKNDIWALGITMLVSLTNEDYNIFYDWHNQEIHYDMILSRLRRTQLSGYSPDFMQALKLMLEKDENRRANLLNLSDFIARAPKPMYVSELQDLEVSMDDMPVQPIQQPFYAQAPHHQQMPLQQQPLHQQPSFQQPSFQRQMSHRSNQQTAHSEIFPGHGYHSGFQNQNEVYSQPIAKENQFAFKPTYDQPRSTAPMQFGHPMANEQQHQGRGQSPLNHRFGNGPSSRQQTVRPFGPQQILRDIGNVGQWQQEEPRFQSPRPQKHRKQAMSHRTITSPYKEQFPPQNAWQQQARYTHFN